MGSPTPREPLIGINKPTQDKNPPWPYCAGQRPIKSYGANTKTCGADRQMWVHIKNPPAENLDLVGAGFPCKTVRKPIETIGNHRQIIGNHKEIIGAPRETKENHKTKIGNHRESKKPWENIRTRSENQRNHRNFEETQIFSSGSLVYFFVKIP